MGKHNIRLSDVLWVVKCWIEVGNLMLVVLFLAAQEVIGGWYNWFREQGDTEGPFSRVITDKLCQFHSFWYPGLPHHIITNFFEDCIEASNWQLALIRVISWGQTPEKKTFSEPMLTLFPCIFIHHRASWRFEFAVSAACESRVLKAQGNPFVYFRGIILFPH